MICQDMFVYTVSGLTNLNYIEIFVSYLADSVKNDSSVNSVSDTSALCCRCARNKYPMSVKTRKQYIVWFGKGKFHPITCHECIEGVYRYSFTLF